MMTGPPLVVLAACLIEICVLRPALFARGMPHPINWIADFITRMETLLNRPDWSARRRRGLGILTLAVVMLAAGGLGGLIEYGLSRFAWGWLPIAAIGAFGLAAGNLRDHVAAILKPLSTGDLASAREAVGRIVGRDTATLNESGIATAAVESLAESFCDGVIAPLFWFLIGGLGGLFAYKAVNTADSLIGHKELRWRAFGWAAARMDDLLNLVPARLSGLIIVLAAAGRGLGIMLRDARRHASPNGGWPEAAMAGALGCRLGGPVSYDGAPAQRATLGDGPPPAARALSEALQLYVRATLISLIAIAAIGIVRFL